MAGLLAFTILAMTISGCTYALRDGVALYSRAQIEDKFKTMERADLEAAVAEATEADPEGVVRANTRTHLVRNDYGWLWVEDRIEYRKGLTVEVPATDDTAARTIKYRDNVLISRGTGLPSLIYGHANYQLFDLESGQPYARMRSRSAILSLIYWGEVVKPTARSIPLPDKMGPLSWEPSEYNYSVTRGTSLIWGLLAAGKKDGRAFAQVLWIPIPLWSTDPAPTPVDFQRGTVATD